MRGGFMSIGYYLVVILLFAIFGVLISGVALMGIGGKLNMRYGNRLMVARVSLQGLALMLLALLFAMDKS